MFLSSITVIYGLNSMLKTLHLNISCPLSPWSMKSSEKASLSGVRPLSFCSTLDSTMREILFIFRHFLMPDNILSLLHTLCRSFPHKRNRNAQILRQSLCSTLHIIRCIFSAFISFSNPWNKANVMDRTHKLYIILYPLLPEFGR